MSKPKKPHPQVAQLSQGIPSPGLIAKNEGTPGLLGSLLHELPVQLELLRHNGDISEEQYLGLIRHFSSDQQKAAALDHLIHLFVDRRRPPLDPRRSVRQSRLVMKFGAVLARRILLGTGQTIEMHDTVLGDMYVQNAELSAQRVGDTTSVQMSTPEHAVISAAGSVPSDETAHRSVGTALQRHLGFRHRVVVEELPSAGARVRDGTLDPQVDVFLEGVAEADDVSVQVVQLKALADELGRHNAAVATRVDSDSVQRTITHKSTFSGKDRIDLVVYCPTPIGTPTRETLSAHAYDTHGYRRAWLVDATGWTTVLHHAARTVEP